MDYIKIVLFSYILLRFVNIFPSTNIHLQNDTKNLLLFLLLLLLAYNDPIVCILAISVILLNINTVSKETLFTELTSEDILNITKTFEPKPKPEKKQKPNPEKKPKPESTCKEKLNAVLEKTQNNIVDQNSLNMFPNETGDKEVNIQGFFHDIKGFNLS